MKKETCCFFRKVFCIFRDVFFLCICGLGGGILGFLAALAVIELWDYYHGTCLF